MVIMRSSCGHHVVIRWSSGGHHAIIRWSSGGYQLVISFSDVVPSHTHVAHPHRILRLGVPHLLASADTCHRAASAYAESLLRVTACDAWHVDGDSRHVAPQAPQMGAMIHLAALCGDGPVQSIARSLAEICRIAPAP